MAGEKILIVEDDNIIASYLAIALDSFGYAASGTASSGEEAIIKAAETNPDLILMDIRLKGEMDGVEAANRIRMQSDIPIVYLTTHTDKETLQRAKSTEPFGYVIKPFHSKELYTAIEMAFHQYAQVKQKKEESRRDIIKREQREREMEAILKVAAALRAAFNRAEMANIILDQLMGLLKAKGAALAMLDPASGEIVIELGQGDWSSWTGLRIQAGQGVSGYVISNGRPYVNDDVRKDTLFTKSDFLGSLQAVVCVPLVAQDQTIGAIWVGRSHRSETGCPSSQACSSFHDDLPLLSAVADMAANAIRRVTLHQQTEQRLQRLTALRIVDTAISACLDLRVTLKVILAQVVNQLGVDAADVLILKPKMNMLEYAAGRGFRSKAIEGAYLGLGESFAGKAALEHRLISIPDLRTYAIENPAENRRLAEENFQTGYAIPLMAKGQVKGVLETFHRRVFKADSDWLDFLETMAGQTAIAIEHADLFNDLQRSNVELNLAYETTIEGWAKALELRDQETEGHAERVTELTQRIAYAFGFSAEELVHVRRGALLHDIGKMGIPDSILLKPGQLTPEEWEIMRKHSRYAYDMLSPIAYLRSSIDIPYCHHEKWDGTGYPRGLKAEQIPLPARIFALVDVYDALRSDRPYRPAWPEERVREHIRSLSGSHFDPRVVEVFLKDLPSGPKEQRY